MEFEWDKNKNQTNIRVHAIDFHDARRANRNERKIYKEKCEK